MQLVKSVSENQECEKHSLQNQTDVSDIQQQVGGEWRGGLEPDGYGR